MRILFLDIDGVLNSDQWDQTERPTNNDFLEDQFDPKAVDLLNDLVEAIDAQIVLTSSWRLNFEKAEMNELFSKVGIHRDIISFTPNLNAGQSYLTRGNEILKWCIDNENRTQSKANNYLDYLILDDNADFLLCQANNFFQTDASLGLTPKIVKEIIKKFR
jgi:hypothetical protein